MQDWNFLILGAWPLGLQRGNYLEGTKTVYNALVLMELNAAFNLHIYSYIHGLFSASVLVLAIWPKTKANKNFSI